MLAKGERLKLLLMVQLVWRLVGVIARRLDMQYGNRVIFCVLFVHSGNSDLCA